MSKKSRRRASLEPAHEPSANEEVLGDERASLHPLTGKLRDIFDAIVCGTALTAADPLPPEVFDEAADELLKSADGLANEAVDGSRVDDDTVELDDLDEDELEEAIASEVDTLGAALGGVALTTRTLAHALVARVLGRDERPPLGDYVPDREGAQRTETARAIDEIARSLLPSSLPDELRPSRSDLKAAVTEATHLVREVGLEAFDVSCYIETTSDGSYELFVHALSPEAAHVSLLEFLFERAENVVANLDPLLLVERDAAAWEFSRWSVSPPPGMRSPEEPEFARHVRDHEYALVDHRSMALGRSVIAELASDASFAELFPREHRMAGALVESFVEVLRCESLTGSHATFRSLRSGRTYHVHEHMDPIEYGVGWIAAGRLMPFEGRVHLRSPGTIFFQAEDPEFLAGAIASMHSAHGSLPPALALEAFISSAVFDVSVPRDVKPARSRASAREALAEIQALLADVERDADDDLRPDATVERFMAALAEQGEAGRSEGARRRAKKATRRR